MKLKLHLFLALLALCLYSCNFNFGSDRGMNYQNSKYAPILISRTELSQSVKMQAPRAISNRGKIYIYGSYLFVNERNEGIHIINNGYTRLLRHGSKIKHLVCRQYSRFGFNRYQQPQQPPPRKSCRW
jgi:hypothetical protein